MAPLLIRAHRRYCGKYFAPMLYAGIVVLAILQVVLVVEAVR